MFWDNISTINEVTFRQLLGMTSGVQDYYQDTTNWLMKEVLSSTRDVEPLEYLAHQSKEFLFAPTSGRASYSTNGFSLVGLALAGYFNLSHWQDLDQRALAWGDQLFPDDQTLFPVRGPCTNDHRIAHQWTSNGLNKTFHDIAQHSCLNSWMGGDIAARPLDVARFTYRVFTGKLLNQSSLKEMTQLHKVTDGFAAGFLAYGLGLEAMWNDGKPTPTQSCGGMFVYGHAGADYGSGAPLNGYIPELKLGVSLAFTSMPLFGASPMGMNCSMRYESLGRMPEMAMNDLINAVREEAGLEPACPSSKFVAPPASECQDAPSFGHINFIPMTCSRYVEFVSKMSAKATPSVMCNYVFERTTLAEWMESQKQRGARYTPPPGYNVNTTRLIDLCKGTCGAVGAGPCWLRGAEGSWCTPVKTDAADSTDHIAVPLPEILV
jgi:CubicO group peptidase (beta-lactamase class C family)